MVNSFLHDILDKKRKSILGYSILIVLGIIIAVLGAYNDSTICVVIGMAVEILAGVICFECSDNA